MTLLLAVAAALFGAGCGETHADHHAHDHHRAESVPAATFEEARGLQLTPAARAFIGLDTAEVARRDFAAAKGAAAVPVAAVLRTVRGDFVYVVTGEWFRRTPVSVAGSDDTQLAITDGLRAGDRVVIGGVRALWLAEIQARNSGAHVH